MCECCVYEIELPNNITTPKWTQVVWERTQNEIQNEPQICLNHGNYCGNRYQTEYTYDILNVFNKWANVIDQCRGEGLRGSWMFWSSGKSINSKFDILDIITSACLSESQDTETANTQLANTNRDDFYRKRLQAHMQKYLVCVCTYTYI